MWRILCLGTALLALTTGVAAEAADAQSRFQAYGLGRLPCKRFVEICESKKDECKLTGTWLEGYLSGFNALNQDTFDILPWQPPELLAEFTFNVCKQNPEAPRARGRQRADPHACWCRSAIKAAAERVKIGEGDQAVASLPGDRARAAGAPGRGRLSSKGKADGAFGPGTEARGRGVPEGGRPARHRHARPADHAGACSTAARSSRARPSPGRAASRRRRPPPRRHRRPAGQPPAKLDLNLVPTPQ